MPQPSRRGRCTSSVERLLRSTSVPIADRSSPDDQVALPVAGDGTVLGLGGPLAEDDVGGDVPLRLVPRPGSRLAQRPAGAQAGDQLTLERAAALDEQRLVDRLVADAHGLIIGEVDHQPVRDLLRAPGRRPTAGPPVRLVQPLPRAVGGPGDDRAVRTLRTCPPSRSCTYSRSRSLSTSFAVFGRFAACLRLPLRDRRPVLRLAAAGRGVAAQLTRDRRRDHARARGRSRARPWPCALQQRDLLTLGERQVAARGLGQAQTAACRQRDETTASRPATTRRPPAPPPPS